MTGNAWADEDQGAVIQVIADIIAIQTSCRSLDVSPGYAFQYGERNGLPMVDIMPGGRRRKEFDDAFAKSSLIDPSELCSSVAAKYEAQLPGTIGQR
jgi:hypothetical protein